MTAAETPSERAQPPKKRSRVPSYVAVLIAIAFVVAAAYYQEPIGLFLHLRAWDTAAPGRIVKQFLAAAQRGDQQAAGTHLRITGGTPVIRDGKWIGYRIPTGMVAAEPRLDDFLPAGEPKIDRTEFIYQAEGAADVWVPGRTEQVKYRLKRFGGEWRITEIVELR